MQSVAQIHGSVVDGLLGGGGPQIEMIAAFGALEAIEGVVGQVR